MLTLLATISFLGVIAFSAWTIVQLVDESGAKMIAALKGEAQPQTVVLSTRPITVRMSARSERVRVRAAQPQWRAAA